MTYELTGIVKMSLLIKKFIKLLSQDKLIYKSFKCDFIIAEITLDTSQFRFEI